MKFIGKRRFIESYKIIIFILLLNLAFPSKSLSNDTYGLVLRTASEASGFTRLTKYEEIIFFIKELEKLSPDNISIQNAGTSKEGREIPLIVIKKKEEDEEGADRNDLPTILIFAQQHGNEPAGKEASLLLARELVTGGLRHLLENINVLIMPSVNPDGAEKDKRENLTGIDINRDYLLLRTPEAQSVHRVFLEWMPEVVIDVHEYSRNPESWVRRGLMRYYDITMSGPTNPNVSENIKEYLNNKIMPYMDYTLKNKGFSFKRHTRGGPPPIQIRFPRGDINRARNYFGLFNTLSLLLEGKILNNSTEKLKHRVNSIYTSLEAILQFAEGEHTKIKKLVDTERNMLLSVKDPSGKKRVIHTKYFRSVDKNPFPLKYFAFKLDTQTPVLLNNINIANKLTIEESVTVPVAYIIPGDKKELIDLLKMHGVKFEIFKEANMINPDIEDEEDLYIAYTDQIASNFLTYIIESKRNSLISKSSEDRVLNQIDYRIRRIENR